MGTEALHLEGLEILELQIILFVLIAIGVAILARRLRVPYTVAMVLTGLAVSFATAGQDLITIDLEPELILLAFLPGLLFESAYHLNLNEFVGNLKAILLLAVPGVLLSMGIIGFLLHQFLGLPLIEALLFGVLISATDPIAVVALFKELGVDKKLGILVEGESLLNDGVAVVLFGILLSLVLGDGEFSLGRSLGEFVITVAGGALLGFGIGSLANIVLSSNEEHLIDIAVTVIVAYGTYWVAEVALSGLVSPVIAVVVAGLTVGTHGAAGGYSATSENTIVGFWEFVAFLLNSFVFLLIGLDTHPENFVVYAGPLAISIVVILFARALVIYGMRFVINAISPRSGKGQRREHVALPWSWSHVLVWGGLRGAVSMALALSLPPTVPNHELIRVLAFGYVLFSIVVQGVTMKNLLSWMGMTTASEAQHTYQLKRGQVATAQAAISAIEELERTHVISPQAAREWIRHFHHEVDERWRELVTMDIEHEENLGRANIYIAEREVANRKKSALMRLLNLGIISEEVYDELVRDIDRRVADDTMLPTYSVSEAIERKGDA